MSPEVVLFTVFEVLSQRSMTAPQGTLHSLGLFDTWQGAEAVQDVEKRWIENVHGAAFPGWTLDRYNSWVAGGTSCRIVIRERAVQGRAAQELEQPMELRGRVERTLT